MRDARMEAGIVLEKSFHSLPIAGEDDHQIFTLVFHHLKQYLDSLRTVIPFIFGAVQVVRFIDKQHAAHRPLEDFSGFGGGVADILSDEIIASSHYEMAPAHITHMMEHLRH